MKDKGSEIILYKETLNIASDTLLQSPQYAGFLRYKELLKVFQDATKEGKKLDGDEALAAAFIKANPAYFHVYSILGQYYQGLENYDEALKYYNLALTKEVSSGDEKRMIDGKIKECQEEKE